MHNPSYPKLPVGRLFSKEKKYFRFAKTPIFSTIFTIQSNHPMLRIISFLDSYIFDMNFKFPLLDELFCFETREVTKGQTVSGQY